MHFAQCDTSCPLTCQNYQSPPTFCTYNCNPRCACDEGYILLWKGSSTCLTKDQCPVSKDVSGTCIGTPSNSITGSLKKEANYLIFATHISYRKRVCPPHMHFDTCDTSCPITCQNYRFPPMVCPLNCNPRCACDEGYILSWKGSSTCVKKDQCPINKGCPYNMHYDTCGTGCPLTCDNYRQPLICTKDCKTGCFCNDGFVQLSNGSSICVEKNQCPVCKELGCEGKHREYKKCGSACPKNCANSNRPPACI
ncbi:von Willebrand factor-like [Ascaphus truei]|uniref:von Willebrand factor-like n=1 Tax=Ascaphus truei TaxID=8439 RepID=UPI003F595CE8